jgi:tRNA (guanine-N7-)-methyltransferase
VGKGKLKKFQENATFSHVIEPDVKSYLAYDHPLKGKWNSEIFKNNNPIVLELGCGKGEYSVGLAKRFPEKNFIGIDIKGARIWRGAKTSHLDQLNNIAFLRTRIEIVNSFFTKDEVSEIWITFPDPQLKRKRAKKRLTSSGFLSLYQQFLIDNGTINLKTDSAFLHSYTVAVAKHNQLIIELNTTNLYAEKWVDDILSIKTHYEQLHIDDGDTINYLKFKLPYLVNLTEPDFNEPD